MTVLKLSIKDIFRQKQFRSIAIISGILLGILYHFLTLSSIPAHITYDLAISPQYVLSSIGLTLIVAVLGGINIALVAYNIQTQKMRSMKKSSASAIFGGALTAFTPGCPACTTSLSAVLGM